MSFNIYHISTIISITLLVFVIELVRRRKLKEQYSLLWIFVSVFMVFASIRTDIIEEIALKMGVYYPPAALLLFGLLFALILILHFSVIISKLTSQHVKLVQEVGLLSRKVELLERKLIDGKPGRNDE